MEQFQIMVKDALFNTNNAVRAESEKKVSEFCTQNPAQFFEFSVVELANESSVPEMRQGCGTLLMRAIRMPGKQGAPMWFDLEESKRNQIKQALMITLVTKVIIARRAAATAIAAIFALETPLKLWPQLIPILINNLSHVDTEVKKAALMTLGFICGEIKNTNQNCLEQNQVEEILMGILIGMVETESNHEIREISVKALHDSLNFMENVLQNKNIRSYLMKCVLFSLSVDSKSVKIKTAQCLIDFCKLYYPFLEEYIQNIFDSLSPLLVSSDEEISIPAIEVFNTIAIEDRERDSTRQSSNVQNQVNASLSLTKVIYQNLLSILLQKLLTPPNESEDGELNLHDTVSRCVGSIVEFIGDPSLNLLGDFISKTVDSEQWIHRQAAMIAFSSLLEGPSKEKVESMIQIILEKIVGLLQDKHTRVQLNASNTLNRISELYPLSILNHQGLVKFSNVLAIQLTAKPNISRNICWVFNFLSDAFPSIDVASHPINQSADLILQNLYKNTARSDLAQTDLNVIDISFMALINFLHYLNDANIANKYLYIFIDQFKNTYSLPHILMPHIQSGLLSAMHSALLRIPQVDDSIGAQVYELVIEYFKLKKEVTADGIYAMSALSAAWKKGFLSHLPEYWNFLLFALGKMDDVELFKSAIGSLADISRTCENEFDSYLPQVVPALIQCLRSPDVNREVKLHIFLCLGDIALGCKFSILPYMDEIKKIFDIGFSAAIDISKDNDSMDYAEQLKEKLVESYICFVHCLGGTEHGDILIDHFPNLFTFMAKVTQSDLNPTVDFLRNVLALVADIANFYKKKVTSLVKTQFTQDLINTLQRFIYIKDNELMIKYAVHVIQNL